MVELEPDPTAQAFGQHHRAISNPNEAAHCMTDCFKHAAHLAVAAFGNRHPVPAVGTFTAAVLN